jgi:Tfp pilus assembly protein PilO
MSNALEQLPLTPQERRIVVAIGLVVIVVLNLLFVWPHFGEWSKTQRQLEQTYREIENYNRGIAEDLNPTNGLRKQLDKLEKRERQEGAAKPVESEVALQTTIKRVADANQVRVDKYLPIQSTKADDFFEEQAEQITIVSQEPQLINFLYQIGNDPSMIRVSSLTLNPEQPNRYKFTGTLTLTANYAKKPASAAAAKPVKAPIPPGKQPAAPVKQPAKPNAGPKQGPAQTPPAGRPGGNARPAPGPTNSHGQNSIRKNL